MAIDETVRVVESIIGNGVEIREFSTIHDSYIGVECRISERVSIKKSKIGTGVEINAGSYIEKVEIHDYAQIGPNCNIVGVTHEFSLNGVNYDDIFNQIIIGEGVWIGAGCTILPGVLIGAGAVVGAGSIVKKNIEGRHRYIGTPLQNRCEPISSKN